ncbi:hypothetical protein D3C80_1334290 [compost metagenome]
MFDEAGKALRIRQQLAVIGPIHMSGKKRRDMGDAHRGHGVHHPEKLDADV